MTSPPVVVGRYRLDSPVRPDIDPSTWRGMDIARGLPVRVSLVDGETGSAARSRKAASHPGLLQVVDVVKLRDGVSPPLQGADPRGDTFVVLEPAVGETLEELVERKGAIDAVRAVRLLLAVANGLAAIHAAGSVHGGVVPLALEIRSLEDGGPRLGLAGVHDGAMAYASPSRLCDGGPSTHDDAWGLLACLYFAVAGRAPFAAESPQALARRVLGGRPVPIRAETGAELELQKLFDRGFSRTAGQRYPDVGALRDDLRTWLQTHGQSSDAPLVTVAPPPVVATAITAKKPATVPPEAYPRVYPTTTSQRNKTVPWGVEEIPEVRAEATNVSQSPAPGTPRETPVARASGPSVPPAPSRPERPTSTSEPPATPRPGSDETARFSREQLEMLGREADRAAAADEPVAARVDAMAATFTADALPSTERKLRSAAPKPGREPAAAAGTPRRLAVETAAPGEVVERAAPLPPRAQSLPPRSDHRVLKAFAAGAVITGMAVTGVLLIRSSVVRAPSTPAVPSDAPRSSVTAAPTFSLTANAPAASSFTVSSSVPPPAQSTSPPAGPSSAPPSTDELLTCVARSFPPDTFDPDADLGFVCQERDGRRGTQKLRRAIVAGAKGARISEAMREWSRYRWFELPVYATVRARCCPGAPPVDPPAVSTTCSTPRDTLNAVGTAAATGTDLDGALRQYRRLVSCLMDSGDFPAFGQDGPIGGGEEAAFRAVVARGKR